VLMRNYIAGVIFFLMMLGATLLPAYADHDDYYDDPRYYKTESPTKSIVKKALVGAAIGGAIGGFTAGDNKLSKGIVRGALIGGAVGGGYGYLREKGYLGGNRNANRYQRVSMPAQYRTYPYVNNGYYYPQNQYPSSYDPYYQYNYRY
jgi:hypothetical protein